MESELSFYNQRYSTVVGIHYCGAVFSIIHIYFELNLTWLNHLTKKILDQILLALSL